MEGNKRIDMNENKLCETGDTESSRKTRITIKRTFGTYNVLDLYSDYVAQKIAKEKRLIERVIA